MELLIQLLLVLAVLLALLVTILYLVLLRLLAVALVLLVVVSQPQAVLEVAVMAQAHIKQEHLVHQVKALLVAMEIQPLEAVGVALVR